MLKQTTTYAIRIGGAMLLALAAACGGDEEPSKGGPGGGFDGGASPVVVDAGATPGTGTSGLDSGVCVTTPFGTGVTCTLAGGNPGYRSCVNGMPTGDCMSF